MQSALIALPCGSEIAPAQQTPTTKGGLQTAPVVSEKSEMTKTGTTDATTEDTDPGPKRGGEIGVDPETGQRSLAGSGATRGKGEVDDIRMESEMG